MAKILVPLKENRSHHPSPAVAPERAHISLLQGGIGQRRVGALLGLGHPVLGRGG